ncbi:MAG TPA: FAD-dependent oxidoreductase [Terriglobales bacterium]|nr:FAD-dependent oxidoreductase [Terriglobales bacterium]
MHDLIVIGAGPGGSSAAITAAQAGAGVLLLEKGRFPRHKVCGEFVSAESLELLSILLAPQYAEVLSEAIRIPQSRIFLDGRVLQAEITPAASSIARFDLDLSLWNSAMHAGVEALEQITVQNISWAESFMVRTTRGELESHAVIDATGRWSNLTAKAVETPREKWLGVKGHFAEKSPLASVDLYFFDGGYCGVSPVELAGSRPTNRIDAGRINGCRINACAMVRADVASNLAEVFELNPALRERSRDWQPLIDTVSTSPLIFRDPTPLRGNILLAGDAAAFVDPFIGDGISLALRGGATAARALRPYFQELIPFEQACENYQREYQKNLARVYHASSKIRRMLKIPRRVRKPFVFLLEKNPAITRYLVRKTR